MSCEAVGSVEGIADGLKIWTNGAGRQVLKASSWLNTCRRTLIVSEVQRFNNNKDQTFPVGSQS
jgi:hypothetical protein